jgi:adenine-specific DNA-methyltransferase
MMEGYFSTAFARVKELAEDFQAGEQQFLHFSFSEAQARKDFIDKFWIALGWDVNHDARKTCIGRMSKSNRASKPASAKASGRARRITLFTPRGISPSLNSGI